MLTSVFVLWFTVCLGDDCRPLKHPTQYPTKAACEAAAQNEIAKWLKQNTSYIHRGLYRCFPDKAVPEHEGTRFKFTPGPDSPNR